MSVLGDIITTHCFYKIKKILTDKINYREAWLQKKHIETLNILIKAYYNKAKKYIGINHKNIYNIYIWKKGPRQLPNRVLVFTVCTACTDG